MNLFNLTYATLQLENLLRFSVHDTRSGCVVTKEKMLGQRPRCRQCAQRSKCTHTERGFLSCPDFHRIVLSIAPSAFPSRCLWCRSVSKWVVLGPDHCLALRVERLRVRTEGHQGVTIKITFPEGRRCTIEVSTCLPLRRE